jgi:hypothetical protein
MLFARLNDMLAMTATLTLSPTDELRYVAGLREGIEAIGGPLPQDVLASPVFTATVPISQSVNALKLSQEFTQTLTYRSPLATFVAITDVPAYQTWLSPQRVRWTLPARSRKTSCRCRVS